MKRIKFVLPFLLILSLFWLTGCEDDSSTGTDEPTSINGWISQGWSEYQSRSYEDASESFENALVSAESSYGDAYQDSVVANNNNDPDGEEEAHQRMVIALGQITESLNGLGWTIIELNYESQGNLVFASAIELTPDYVDAIAGYAILLQIHENWQQSNEKITTALTLDPTWDFRYNNVDYLDLRVMRAENYFFLAEYQLSLDEALMVNDIVGYQSGLSADDFNLATIEGRAALINLIDALDDLI